MTSGSAQEGGLRRPASAFLRAQTSKRASDNVCRDARQEVLGERRGGAHKEKAPPPQCWQMGTDLLTVLKICHFYLVTIDAIKTRMKGHD